jgi:hypothetical protein
MALSTELDNRIRWYLFIFEVQYLDDCGLLLDDSSSAARCRREPQVGASYDLSWLRH